MRTVRKVLGKKYFVFVAGLASLTLVIGVIIYFYAGTRTQESLAEQMLHRQQIVVRAGALSLEGFFNGYAHALTLGVSSRDISKIKKSMDIYTREWSNIPIEDIILTDSKGSVIYNVNSENISNLGVDISDRDYFKWAKTAKIGDFYINTPVVSKIGVSKNKYVVPISIPVFDNSGKNSGTVTSGVLVDSLVHKYSDPFKFSDKTRVYLVDSDGNFVFSPNDSINGTNFSDIFKNKNFPQKDNVNHIINLFKQGLVDEEEGKFDIVLPDLDGGGKMTRYLAAYSRVSLDGQKDWFYIIITPASDAFLFEGPFYKDQIHSLVFLVVVVIAFSFAAITIARIKPKYEQINKGT